ncbi:hypothetical protein GF325_03300 [Candidatus Bathyarchaeota archaeon]|nr:hypothetical protein [Candidatus Bathyarchaeota archaeon]
MCQGKIDNEPGSSPRGASREIHENIRIDCPGRCQGPELTTTSLLPGARRWREES